MALNISVKSSSNPLLTLALLKLPATVLSVLSHQCTVAVLPIGDDFQFVFTKDGQNKTALCPKSVMLALKDGSPKAMFAEAAAIAQLRIDTINAITPWLEASQPQIFGGASPNVKDMHDASPFFVTMTDADAKIAKPLKPTKKTALESLLANTGVMSDKAQHTGADTSISPAPLTVSTWTPVTPEEMTTLQRVHLRDGTRLYQPVLGTSKEARYHLVAGCSDLKVGARYSSGVLSIRVEGTGLEGKAAKLAACGFDKVVASKGYASMHLQVDGDDVLASKALGSILLGLSVPFETPIPDLLLLKGKGNH